LQTSNNTTKHKTKGNGSKSTHTKQTNVNETF